MSNHTPNQVVAVWRAWRGHGASLRASLRSGLDPDVTLEIETLLEEWEIRCEPSLRAMHAYLSDVMLDKSWSLVVDVGMRGRDELIEKTERALHGAGPVPDVHYFAAFDPRFDENPLVEMNEGVTREYSTDGSGASDGLKISLTAPLSWLPGHARGGGMAMRLVSEAGVGLASLSLVVVPLADDEATPGLVALIEKITSDPVRVADMTLLGEPAKACVFSDESTGRRGASRSFNKHVLCVLDRRVVKFEFSVADRARSAEQLLSIDELETELERLEPLFDEIVKRASVASEP